ncbi:MAG: pilus assembly protein [Thermoleophilaceae bacterium]
MQRGQASIELLGAVPALLLVALVLMQLLVVGYTAVLAGDAAEAGALAIARGGSAKSAASGAVPGWVRRGVRVSAGTGAVRVEMRPPALLPWAGRLLHVHATAAVAAPGRLPLVPGVPFQ